MLWDNVPWEGGGAGGKPEAEAPPDLGCAGAGALARTSRAPWPWERQQARSRASRSAPDIPLAAFSAALASRIFVLTSHGLRPFPPLPSVSLL